MDSLSSFGKVHTMKEDLAAAQNKSRPSEISPVPIPKKEGDKIAERMQAAVTPITQAQKEASIKRPAPTHVLPIGRPTTSLPKKEVPTPPALPSRPQVPTPPAAAPTIKQPTAPKLPSERQPVVLGALPPRPVPPPLQTYRQGQPGMPAERAGLSAPSKTPEQTPAARPQNLFRLLPVEEEGAKLPPSTLPAGRPGVQFPATPPAAAKPSLPRVAPIAPQVKGKGMTPEEILGIKPAPLPAVGLRAGQPSPPPIAPSATKIAPTPPVPPTRPRLPTSPPPPIYESSYRGKKAPFGLIALAIVLVLSLGGFFAWRIIMQRASQQPPAPTIATPPAPFFKPDNTTIITLQQGREGFLIEQIRALENMPGNTQSITYIPIKKSPGNTFLGSKEFFSTIGISIPQELLDDVGDRFMLYLYTPGLEEKTRCTSGNITDSSCFSPRLGIVLQVDSGKEIAVQNIMSGLEPILLQTFTPIILGNPAFSNATPWNIATYTGLSVPYTQLPVRYSNLPISTTSLNWTRDGSYLVIATSKNSSYAALDKLVAASQTNTNASAAGPNSDIEKVKAILVDMRQGYITSNATLFEKYASKATLATIASTGFKVDFGSTFTVNNVSQAGSNIISNVTIVSGGTTQTQDMVFIKEDGDWKYDLTATFQYAIAQNNAKKGTGNPNGLPDFIVTGVTVYPSHPIVNSKDVAITISIKNIGTKTADNGLSISETLVGFTNEFSSPATFGDAIAPGETVTDVYRPYEANNIYKISDTPGQKTIQITLNSDHAVVESNYNNNVFTQTVQMYSK